MNDTDSNELLKNELSDLRRMATHLQESLKNCASLPENPPVEDLWSESVEAFMSRFARTADLLVNKSLRTLVAFELEEPGTLLDILQKAEKRGIIDSAANFRKIKQLRNMIVHDYAGEDLAESFTLCRQWTPELLKGIVGFEKYLSAKFQIHAG
jgi:uncharacterized protein YutE (UPF0331/DUF86 family)